MQVYDNLLIHRTLSEIKRAGEKVAEHIASISLRRERQHVVEREIAIDLIMGLCELAGTPISSNIGANDFIGANYISSGDNKELSGSGL